MKVLLADDEVTITVTLSDALVDAGHEVFVASDTDSALRLLEDAAPEAVLTDIRMPGAGGMAVLARSIELDSRRPVIIMTGFASLEQAQEAVELGASLFVQKPFRNEALVSMVETCGRLRDLERENETLRKRLETGEGFEGVVGTSAAMRAVFDRVRTVAPTDATVLIEGESGTGKERIARAVHDLSTRAEGPFVALSCAALPESLLEAELFGHERGAFTDARKERKGRFELADGGTFFLDDIDDMPLGVQVKLLRVLQERSIERVGGEDTIEVDIRVLAATKAPLRERVREGRFREDLYYRIQVVPIELPPLRQREGDVPPLFAHLLERHGGGRSYKVSNSTMRALERYPWPGNVRELENAVQRAVALAGDREALVLEDLLPQDPRWRDAIEVSDEVRPLRDVVREAERRHLERAIEATGGHRMQAAELLGISRKVLWEKLRDHGLGKREGDE